MRRTAAIVDSARPPGQSPVWEWFPGHIEFVGTGPGVPEILLTAISLYDEGNDWLEAELDVDWTEHGLLNVCAAVSVACLCVEDHNTHYAASLNVAVDSASLGEAFEAAAHQLIKWLEEPQNPAYWRTRVTLPQRS